MNVQEVFTFLVSGGDSLKEELLDTWRRHLDQYANIHSQQVADHVMFPSYQCRGLLSRIHLVNHKLSIQMAVSVKKLKRVPVKFSISWKISLVPLKTLFYFFV